MEYLKTLTKQGKVVVITSHDLTLLEKYIDRVWFLNHGVLETDQPLDQFLASSKQQAVRTLVVHYQDELDEEVLANLQHRGIQILHKKPLEIIIPSKEDTNEWISRLLTKVKIEAIQPKVASLSQVYEETPLGVQ